MKFIFIPDANFTVNNPTFESSKATIPDDNININYNNNVPEDINEIFNYSKPKSRKNEPDFNSEYAFRYKSAPKNNFYYNRNSNKSDYTHRRKYYIKYYNK